MVKIFKNIFNKKNETESEKLNNDLLNVQKKININKNTEYDNLDMLKDLSLSEKEYLEREIFFKYDCSNYKILNVIRNDNKHFEVICEIELDNKPLKISELIKYEDIKDKNDNF